MNAPTTVWKLTRPDRTTYGDFRYDVGRWYDFPGTGQLCSPGWSHAYTSPQLALLLNPIHAKYAPSTLWRAEGIIGATDHGLKVGCSRLRLVAKVTAPLVTTEQRVTFALWCALAVHREPAFVRWAEGWLSGEDRTAAAAGRAEAAWAEARVAAAAAARAAAWAAATRPLDLDALAHAALLPWEPV